MGETVTTASNPHSIVGYLRLLQNARAIAPIFKKRSPIHLFNSTEILPTLDKITTVNHVEVGVLNHQERLPS